jgi:hypothetical protein
VDNVEIADRLELEQLVVRYTVAIDRKDWDLLDTVFTPDATLDYSSSAPDAAGTYPDMKAWLQAVLAPFPMTQHMIGKSYIEYQGDRAVCHSLFHNPMGTMVDDDGYFDPNGKHLHVFVVGGTYHDTCVRTPDGWRIAKKLEEQQFTQGTMAGPRPA